MSKDTGGSAFPSQISQQQHHPAGLGVGETTKGMTLRDYFAAKAMQGLLNDPNGKGTFKLYAEYSYKFADAMLEARKS